ncbi:Na+/H+ antiporter NhaC family protein [Thiospirochaeta perfilievii]|uniref:Na+/H+ antiporter NhaC family protein n=1 Tax=Thiospirochaeta perfilievii TaxID=252967 RepID=A0A5C1QAA5_9SPIO|nr:Na+/H+ antiporter NhaC family protein [Thiospirochaeta perfilievii]QEN04278.1 Na+/H+ antiporter NhaC family protein [Thiospirochaeta perfilievii]
MDYEWLALLPPIIAIGFALWKRQVILSLLVGVFTGATIIAGWNPLKGLLDTFSVYIVEKSLADSWNIGIIVFLLAVGGMIGVIGKMGGTKAIATAIAKKATDVRSTQLATALMGIAIFFDDYANSIVVGNTMRPITDAQNISREKLAYIVDSSAAPVSSMAPISTWIAMELGLIAAGLADVGLSGDAMTVFFQTIPYRFYSLFALVLLFNLIIQRKDYSTMLKAEIRARKTGKVYADGANPLIAEDKNLLPDDGVDGSIWDVIIPITIFLLVTVFGLWYNGYEEGKNFKDSIGNSDASVVLTWAAFIGSIVAGSIGVIKKRFNLSGAMDSWVSGAKSMFTAVIILTLAFALKGVISEMGLDVWLGEIAKDSLNEGFLPLIVFAASMFMAFAIGSSWGTNGILMPIVIPIAAQVSNATGAVTPLMLACMGSVLTGAVFGDHCSPISDTTILSSSASGSDHIDHVRTQMPYAITAAVFAIIFGFIPAGFGLSPWISLILGLISITLFVKFFGKKIDNNGNIVE